MPARHAFRAIAPEAAGMPLYRVVKRALLRAIESGQSPPGQALPSETELAGSLGVSIGTLRKAVDELVAEHLLVRRQGRGTFVATHAEQTTQYRFLRLQADDGEASGTQRQFIDCRRLRAPADVARALGLRSGDAAIQIKRVLSLRGAPVVFDEIWLPAAPFKGLTAEKLSGYRGPMYGLFESEFGVRMIRAEEKIRAVAAEGQAAELLAVSPGTPLLSVERLSLSYGDKPVELRRGLYTTSAHHYRNELS